MKASGRLGEGLSLRPSEGLGGGLYPAGKDAGARGPGTVRPTSCNVRFLIVTSRKQLCLGAPSGVPGIDRSGPGVGSHVDPGKRLHLAGSGGTTQSRGLLLHFPRVWAHGDSDLTPLLGGERPPLGSQR